MWSQLARAVQLSGQSCADTGPSRVAWAGSLTCRPQPLDWVSLTPTPTPAKTSRAWERHRRAAGKPRAPGEPEFPALDTVSLVPELPHVLAGASPGWEGAWPQLSAYDLENWVRYAPF